MPAKNVQDATLLIVQLELKVNLLVISLALPGAHELIAAFRRGNGHCKIIGLLEDPTPNLEIPGVNAIAPYRPDTLDASATTEWLQCIRQVLANTMQSSG